MNPRDIYGWFKCLFPMWEGKVINFTPKSQDTIRMTTVDGSRIFYFTYKGGVTFTLKSMNAKEAKEYEKNTFAK